MKIILFANTDWYLYNFRLPLAEALRQAGHTLVLLSPDGPYGPRLCAAGFDWRPFPLSRKGQNPFRELDTLLRIFRFYRAEQPDLVHHFTIKCVLYGSLAAHLARVRAVVNSVTGLGYLFVNPGLAARLAQAVVRPLIRLALRGTRVIFQNQDDATAYQSMRLVSADQSALIRGSGVDVERFRPLPLPADPPLVVLPARLLWDKGVGEFVEAARLLRAEGVAARFALVGNSDAGNPAAVPEDTLRGWQQASLVEWWGWQEEMQLVYASAAVVCLPSYREGLPKSLLEAAACARPVVTTDAPGCREVVPDGRNGVLVPVRDARALADGLRPLLLDPALRARMGAAGRELVVESFSTSRIVSETLAVYDRTGI